MSLTITCENAYINQYASVSGPNEGESSLKRLIDYVFESEKGSKKSFEDGESEMINKCIDILLEKGEYTISDIGCILGGDLSNQLSSSSQAIKERRIAFVGLYSACSIFSLSVLLGATLVSSNFAKRVISYASSNYGVSERQFRYPLEYGIMKKETTTITTSSVGGVVISSTPSKIKIIRGTIGEVQDADYKDVNDLGSIMAFAAYFTIKDHLKNTNTKFSDYDYIVTGDLSTVGSQVLEEMFQNDGLKLNNHLDAGEEIYNLSNKKSFAGGSGAGCVAIYTTGYLLRQIETKKIRHVLIVGTGALHSQNSTAQKKVIPVIAHAVELEYEEAL